MASAECTRVWAGSANSKRARRKRTRKGKQCPKQFRPHLAKSRFSSNYFVLPLYNNHKQNKMDTLPAALQYGASQSQARIARQTVRPLGADNGGVGQTVRFKLPSKSIVDLRSLSLYYQYTVEGIVADANNWSNVQIPNSQKHWRSVRFYVSGVLASGGACNHYDQVAHSLYVATGSEDHAFSRMNNSYDEILDSSILSGQPGAAAGAAGHGDGYVAAAGQLPAARSLLMTFDDLLGLPNTKNYCIDTSLNFKRANDAKSVVSVCAY